MNDPYQVLGIPEDCDETAIRRRYLELVRQFPPEQAPERFAQVRAAYEHFLDRDTRLLNRLSNPYRKDALDGFVDNLVAITSRPRVGLSDLLQTHRTGNCND